MATRDRVRTNVIKLYQGKFMLDMKRNFLTIRVVKHWNRLPREAMKPLWLEISKNKSDKLLSGMVWTGTILP